MLARPIEDAEFVAHGHERDRVLPYLRMPDAASIRHRIVAVDEPMVIVPGGETGCPVQHHILDRRGEPN
jgi:hypothetical protein